MIVPMTTFALVASISPGPVNLVGLSTGSRHGLTKGLIFVTGATIGFILLFLAVGYGLSSLFMVIANFERWLSWAGIIFLLYLSYRLAFDSGEIKTENQSQKAPVMEHGHKAANFWTGFLMQWLNPKAWLASAAGISAYTQGGDLAQTWLFAMIYVPVCWISLSCWVCVGVYLRQKVQEPKVMRAINRSLAAMLAGSCLFLVFG